MISLEFVIGLIVTALFTAAAVTAMALSVLARRRADREDTYDRDDWIHAAGLLRWGGLTLIVVTAIFAAWGFYPYDMQYHSFRHVEGTVATVQGRLLGDGKSTTQYYAVRLREDGQTYRCDDTRCSLLHEGDRVALWCIREWQYASTPGWGCNFDTSSEVTR